MNVFSFFFDIFSAQLRLTFMAGDSFVDEWIVFASYRSLLMIQLDITPLRYLRLPRLKLLRLAQGSDIAFSYAIRLAGTTVVLGSVLHT